MTQFPQLDFRMLQHLYYNDTTGRCKDFMVHILNSVQNSGIHPLSYNLRLVPHGFSPLLHHSAIRNALELELCSSKVSVRRQYSSIDVLDRLQVR